MLQKQTISNSIRLKECYEIGGYSFHKIRDNKMSDIKYY